jgi:hypothetical protein
MHEQMVQKKEKQELMVGFQRSKEIIRHTFTDEEIKDLSLGIADNLMKAGDLEDQMKKFKEEIDLKLKPLKSETAEILRDIRNGFRDAEHEVFLVPDYETRTVDFYDLEGNKIGDRRMTMSEFQGNLFHPVK